MSTVSNSVNSVNSVNSYSAVLPPSPMVFFSSVTRRSDGSDRPDRSVGFGGLGEPSGALTSWMLMLVVQ